MKVAAPFAIAACALTLTACASTGAVPRPFPGAALPPSPAPVVTDGSRPTDPPVSTSIESPLGASVVAAALGLQGTPYRNGGSDPTGFDCSGFVQWVFNQLGVRLPREVHDQSLVGSVVDTDHIQPGDLLFFETVSRGASHVGVAVGGGQFVHAPSSRGVVRVERYGGDYWAKRFLMARRVSAPTSTTN